jgi:hypothetical protein
MLTVAIGANGSRCGNCDAPCNRGFELTGCRIFFCTSCAELKFGERETDRATSGVKDLKALVEAVNAMSTKAEEPKVGFQRPMGFLRREPTIC